LARPAPRRHRRALPIIAAIAVLALAATVFLVSSLALFTDTEIVGANDFATGTVDIAATPATAVFTATAMAPGDEVTAPIDVANNGTLELRYALTSSTTEDTLAGQLVMTIREGVTTCDNTNWDLSGTEIYSGVLGSTGATAILGDAAVGAQAGDRTLASLASEVLCVNVALPLAATNASQGLSTTATFNFLAEQTANN
jgi:hypothetical protein